MRLLRRGKHRALPPELEAVVAAADAHPELLTPYRRRSGRCRGTTYRGKPCTLEAGPDGYCVFHKPGAAA